MPGAEIKNKAIRDRAFSGSEHKFPELAARPCGCFASLRSEIVI